MHKEWIIIIWIIVGLLWMDYYRMNDHYYYYDYYHNNIIMMEGYEAYQQAS